MTVARPLTEEPLPVPEQEGPPIRRVGFRRWAKESLFSSRLNGVLTILFGLFLAWVLYRVAKFVFVDADWEIVEVNLRNFMIFGFPQDETWRVWAALYLLAASAGFGAGAAATRRALEVEEGRAPSEGGQTLLLRRVAPLLALAAVLLAFASSLTATVLVVGVAVVAVGFRFLGRRMPPTRGRLAAGLVLVGILAAYAVIAYFGGVAPSAWGGLLLTMFLAVAGILLSFPLGVLLALGRRSKLPAIRLVCVVYIELIRGVPLIAILFMAVFALRFFLPADAEPPSTVTRALVGLILFTAAYVAEVVRGGLQACRRARSRRRRRSVSRP